MTRNPPALPTGHRGHRGAAGRRLGRDLALGASLAAGLPADALGPGLLLGRGDRRGRGLGVRRADPVDRVADARLRAHPHPEEHDVLRGGGRRDRAPLPRAGRAWTRTPPTGRRSRSSCTWRRAWTSTTGSRPCCSTARPGSTSAATATSWWTRSATAVMREFPRRAFDRRFLAAIRRETEIRSDCQSARLLHRNDLAGWMARSPWAGGRGLASAELLEQGQLEPRRRVEAGVEGLPGRHHRRRDDGRPGRLEPGRRLAGVVRPRRRPGCGPRRARRPRPGRCTRRGPDRSARAWPGRRRGS